MDDGNGEVAMAKFTIESRTAKALKLRHLASGHSFTFRISEPKSGARILRGDYAPGRPTVRAVRQVLERAAHAFARRQARKAGLID
jgi:hypothetical protein